MRYLQIFNWLMLAASATMTLVLSVVLLLYWIYRQEPIIQASFESLRLQTAMFAGFLVLAALAAHSLRRRWPAYWVMQGAMLVALWGIVEFYLPND